MTQTIINEKEIMRTRVARIVTELMESRNWFRETLDQEQMIEHLFNIVQRKVNYEEFINLSEETLKNHFSLIMANKAAGSMLNDLTPEQIAMFDEAIKRK